MTISLDDSVCLNSHFSAVEYIPLTVVFDSSVEQFKYFEIRCGNENLIEFTVDSYSNLIKRFTVIISSCFYYISDNMIIPKTYNSGALYLDLDKKTECSVFILNVYNDGVYIKLSNNASKLYYKRGQIFIGENNHSICDIFVTKFSSEEINYIKHELSYI